MGKTIDRTFVYGIQYYRAPTPMPSEWEPDLRAMDKAGIDTIQLRVQWRWNEPAEGQYEFDDIDRLFELATKYDKKVAFKFMMETAPDYIFHKYGGARVDLRGQPISPGAHGAFYVGGWWPCFENPGVAEKAIEFVKVMTARYKNQKNLILWNVWNEPRSRPVGDCACAHSTNAYRQWLKEKFTGIEKLNDFFGKRWESFDTINPPGMPHDYAETFLWREWMARAVSLRLVFMHNAVKEVDATRPIMAHVGCCSVVQDTIGDTSDDIQNSGTVDFYGTSYPVANTFSSIVDEARPFMICDWLRAVSEYYWVYELYPDWGCWCKPVTMSDFKLKVWSLLACGAKGLMYWQYRAERVGNENNLSGLVNIDGSFKDIAYEAGRIKEFIVDNEEFLMSAKVRSDGIGILYSIDSDMISRLENTGKNLWDFDLITDAPYLYKKALWGSYALFKELGYTVDFVDARSLKHQLKNLKLLYVPECFMIDRQGIDAVAAFIHNGGAVIAEEGFGLRSDNTWLNTSWPDDEIKKLFGVSITERLSTLCEVKDDLQVSEHTFPTVEFISYLKAENAEVIGKWNDGRTGAVRQQNTVFLGTSLGAAFHDRRETFYHEIVGALKGILKSLKIENKESLPRGVYHRVIEHQDQKMHFIFNRTGAAHSISIDNEIREIPPMDVKVFGNVSTPAGK